MFRFFVVLCVIAAAYAKPGILGSPLLAPSAIVSAPSIGIVRTSAPIALGALGAPLGLSTGLISNGVISNGLVSGRLISNGLVSGGLISKGIVSGGLVSGGIINSGLISTGKLLI